MATLNIQTSTQGVYSINLQTTPPTTGPYVTVQGENTDVYYAPLMKTCCGPVSVQVNNCDPSSGCWPVRKLASLEHYLICSLTISINCESFCQNIVASRDWFEHGPVDVTIFPPTHGYRYMFNIAPQHRFGINYTWDYHNSTWYTSFTNTCDGCALPNGSCGPWPAGQGYASPNALCWFDNYSCHYYSCSHSTSIRNVGNLGSMLVGLCLTTAAGGPNNDQRYTWAASMGQGQEEGSGPTGYRCVYGGWTAAAYSPGWAIANTTCFLTQASGHISCMNAVTPAVPRATVLCNIMPTSSSGTICFTFKNCNWLGYEDERSPVWGLGTNGCENYSCLCRGTWRGSYNCSPWCVCMLSTGGCVFGGCGCDITYDIVSQGYTHGWINNIQDANAPIYTPNPYHCTETYIHICGWRYA